MSVLAAYAIYIAIGMNVIIAVWDCPRNLLNPVLAIGRWQPGAIYLYGRHAASRLDAVA
jgi:hypothetical protein